MAQHTSVGEDMWYVRQLAELDVSELSRAGGKALNLGVLKREGFNVPDGYCISTEAFAECLRETKAGALIGQMAWQSQHDNQMPDEASLAAIRTEIETYTMPNSLLHEIESVLHKLIDRDRISEGIVVRSSANVEDTSRLSLAGQLRSSINVLSLPNVLESIRKCWSSLFRVGPVGYLRRQRIAVQDVAVAVVLQRMVAAEKAGVLFTVNPVTGCTEEAVIESVFGLGMSALAGSVDPDTYVVRKSDLVILDTRISEKFNTLQPAPEGGIMEQALPKSWQRTKTLSTQEIISLVKIGREIETVLGNPQDIEWCIRGGLIFVLQSRPTTSHYDANMTL
jgi:pyruvate,water dikinase